jgi:hypothetical protein
VMVLSRVWYVLLGVAVAVALYVVYVAVGEYDRQGTHALKEGLASDSQTVEWALKIDARRRLDALLAGSVDATLQQALVAADAAKETRVPEKSKADAKKALASIRDAIPVELRPDAFFAVDRDGRVVAQSGYDSASGNEDFEMGGYPAVNDALHGWLRDDVWVLGSKMYVVGARPVEYDAAQRPAGAIVGLKEVNAKFAQDLANRTRTSVAIYAGGQKMAGGAAKGLEPSKLDAIGNDLKNIDDKAYNDDIRTEARMLHGDLGVLYARLPGDASALGGGFAVVRTMTPLGGPMAFLSGADDQDKANVPLALLAVVVLVAAFVGIGFTVLEHTFPLRELLTQATRFKAGAMDGLDVAGFRGAYRLAAQGINEGIERAIEKAGGVTRKPADLESILGPTPAQPAMSAFSFPTGDESAQAPGPAPVLPPVPALAIASQPAFTAFSDASSPPSAPISPAFARQPAPPPPAPPPPPASVAKPPPVPSAGRPAVASAPKEPPPLGSVGNAASGAGRLAPPPVPLAHSSEPMDDDDATTIATVPADVMARASGGALDESAEWRAAYQDFIRVKKQCGEPTDGLTFEKFSVILRKNRDQLAEKHGVKRVKFSVYVKEGRASLKATPVKE